MDGQGKRESPKARPGPARIPKGTAWASENPQRHCLGLRKSIKAWPWHARIHKIHHLGHRESLNVWPRPTRIPKTRFGLAINPERQVLARTHLRPAKPQKTLNSTSTLLCLYRLLTMTNYGSSSTLSLILCSCPCTTDRICDTHLSHNYPANILMLIFLPKKYIFKEYSCKILVLPMSWCFKFVFQNLINKSLRDLPALCVCT